MKISTAMAWHAGVAVLAVLIVCNDPRQLFASITAMRFWLIAIIA